MVNRTSIRELSGQVVNVLTEKDVTTSYTVVFQAKLDELFSVYIHIATTMLPQDLFTVSVVFPDYSIDSF